MPSSRLHGTSIARDVAFLALVIVLNLGVIIGCCSKATAYLMSVLEEDHLPLVIPRDLATARLLHHSILNAVASASPDISHLMWIWITASFSSIYIFKQTFSVPGSLILNIFAGAVFGITRALPLVTILTICGTSLCYALSHLFGRLLALRLFGQRVARVRNVMKNHRSDLYVLVPNSIDALYPVFILYHLPSMIYLISLRLFPFTPNFLLNLVSPHIGIPFRYFFMSVLVGLLPYNLITTKAGNLLGSLTNMADALDMSNLVQLIVLALVALIPTVFRKRFQAYASLDTPRAGSPKRDRHHKTR